MATRRQAVDNSPAFRWIVKIIYIVYLALYTTYALYNFLHDEGDILINVLVISFTSVSALILIVTTVMDYVVKDDEALSTAKVTLHTLKNIFKVIKVAISVIVLIQTINDNSWSVFNIVVVVMSLPLSLLLLLIEYVYVSIANSVRNRRKGAISLDDFDDEEMAAALLAAKNQQNKRSSAEFWASLLAWELTGYEDIDDISDTYDAVRDDKLKKKLLPDDYVEPEPILE
ncbi:MAG: hypothetical protein K2I79_04845, partial [Clostridia bacterium]|nr:hypothetical protein [Clostridia bacterium]